MKANFLPNAYRSIVILVFLASLAQPTVASFVAKTISRIPRNTGQGNHSHRKDKLPSYQERLVARARWRLKKLNKQPFKSIQSSDGDIVDCVSKNHQPAFDHPLLRDHKIQDPPSLIPRSLQGAKRNSAIRPVSQLWHQNGSCPVGTVPIRRTSTQDILRASSARHYGKKTHRPARTSPDGRAGLDDDMSNSDHEHAIAFVEGSQIYGAQAVLSVWDPSVEASNEFSLSQLWLLGGSFDGDLNSIEAGWQVSPELYGDGRPRLFTYWTTDGYQTTGCYNLLCSGFVQTSNEVAIGASIAPVSTYLGNQYQIEIMVWKDPREGNWWMAFEGSNIVGYWPQSLFSHLSGYANTVEWGGEVVNSKPDGRHTGTQMGSGHYAEEGFGATSFFHSLQVVDASNNLRPVTNLKTLAEHPHCYDIRTMEDANWGAAFYFGGPGRNPLCN